MASQPKYSLIWAGVIGVTTVYHLIKTNPEAFIRLVDETPQLTHTQQRSQRQLQTSTFLLQTSLDHADKNASEGLKRLGTVQTDILASLRKSVQFDEYRVN
jgi:hypothetical protein